MCFLRFEGAGVLSSQARGEHDCSGKKHGSAVPTDGVPEHWQARVTGSFLARGLRGGNPGGGQKAETRDSRHRLNGSRRGNTCAGPDAAGQGRGVTLGVPLPVGEANERWVIRKPLPARVWDRSMVVPSVRRRSTGLVRCRKAWVPRNWVKGCFGAQSFKSLGNLQSRPRVKPVRF